MAALCLPAAGWLLAAPEWASYAQRLIQFNLPDQTESSWPDHAGGAGERRFKLSPADRNLHIIYLSLARQTGHFRASDEPYSGWPIQRTVCVIDASRKSGIKVFGLHPG